MLVRNFRQKHGRLIVLAPGRCCREFKVREEDGFIADNRLIPYIIGLLQLFGQELKRRIVVTCELGVVSRDYDRNLALDWALAVLLDEFGEESA